jgi:hypothetical protein
MMHFPLIGLCTICQHAKTVKSSKGTVFVLCGLSQHDQRFGKYPTLPVIECFGFEQKNPKNEVRDHRENR